MNIWPLKIREVSTDWLYEPPLSGAILNCQMMSGILHGDIIEKRVDHCFLGRWTEWCVCNVDLNSATEALSVE